MTIYEMHYAKLKRDLDLCESPNYVPGYMRKPEYQNITEFICKDTIVLCHASRGNTMCIIEVNGLWYIFWTNYTSLLEPLDESLKERPKLSILKQIYTFLRRLIK